MAKNGHNYYGHFSYDFPMIFGLFRSSYLQATASAADLSSPRCFDDKMLERFADAIVVGLDLWGDARCLYRNICSIPSWLLVI